MFQPILLFMLIIIVGAWRCGSSFSYVEDACSVTRYRDICVRTLSSFSSSAKSNPVKWARAGVSVAIQEAKSTARYAVRMRKGDYSNALSDCVELFQDALDALHKSLYALRNFSNGGDQGYPFPGEDILTWVSAALTDEDTCLDGIKKGKGRIEAMEERVVNVTCMTSNALALVDRIGNAAPPK